MAKKVLTPEEVKAKLEKKSEKRKLFFGTFTKALAFFLAIAMAYSLAVIAFTPATVSTGSTGAVQSGDVQSGDSGTASTPSGDSGTASTPSGDSGTASTPSGDSGTASTPSGDSGSSSSQQSNSAKADAIKAVNDATAKASQGNYHWERESYYTKPLEVSGKDTLNKVIGMVDTSGTATVDSVVGGFLDITGEGNFMTADVQKGQLAVGMKDNPKFLMIASKLTEADVTKAEVNGNVYKLYLKDCNRPQKDGSNALNRVTNDFITCDEVNKGLSDAGAGSLVKANDIDVTFKSIEVTAEIVDGKLVKYDITYVMDVANMNLKALSMVTVNGSGAGVMKCSYTNIKY